MTEIQMTQEEFRKEMNRMIDKSLPSNAPEKSSFTNFLGGFFLMLTLHHTISVFTALRGTQDFLKEKVREIDARN